MQSPLPAPPATRVRRALRGIFLTVSSLAELIDDRSLFPFRFAGSNRVESRIDKIQTLRWGVSGRITLSHASRTRGREHSREKGAARYQDSFFLDFIPPPFSSRAN